MNTLLFIRSRIRRPLERFTRSLIGEDNLVTISDERYVAGVKWWGDYGRGNSAAEVQLTAEEAEDAIRRCRMLRQLPRNKALQLLDEACRRWADVLQSAEIDRVIPIAIDCYILHMLVLVSQRLGIPVVPMVWTPFPNRMRFTVFGELLGENDQPMDDLVDEVYDQFRNEVIRPQYTFGVEAAPWWIALRRVLVDSLKPPVFLAYRLLTGDRDSFLYLPRRLAKDLMFGTPGRLLAAIKSERRATGKVPEAFAFFPLQFYPEATSDYWIREPEMHSHENVVLAVARTVAKSIPVVIKEHPAAFGRRSVRFMRELTKIPNVQLAPLRADPRSLLRKAKFVVGQASTTTFQAQVIGKRVLFYGKPYFDVCSGSVVLETMAPAAIERAVTQVADSNVEPSAEEIRQMIRRFLRSTGTGALGGFAPFFEKPAQRKLDAYAGEDLQRMFATLTGTEVVRRQNDSRSAA